MPVHVDVSKTRHYNDYVCGSYLTASRSREEPDQIILLRSGQISRSCEGDVESTDDDNEEQ